MFIIACPNCQKPLRLPPEMLETTTTCPHCHCYFTAPKQQPDGTLTAPHFLRRNPFAKSKTILPGALLLLFGLFTLYLNSVQAVRTFANPEQFAQENKEYFENLAKQQDNEADQQRALDMISLTTTWLPWLRVVFALMSLVSVLGGLSMLRRWSHGLAMLGSFCALFNVANYCCFGGIPVGGLALFVLFNPQVRAEFLKAKPKNTSSPTPEISEPPGTPE